MTRTTQSVIATQWGTFFWSAVGILLMLTLAFRSVVLALLAILPTMLSVGLVLGLMGWLSIKLDMAHGPGGQRGAGALGGRHVPLPDPVSPRAQGRAASPRASSTATRFPVPGVILSSLAVAVGFTALCASEFEPFVNFGTMVAIATAGSTLGNLVLLPACLTLGHRWRVRSRPNEVRQVGQAEGAIIELSVGQATKSSG